MVSLPLPYVIKLKVFQLFFIFLVSRSLELQKFLLSLYSSHQLFGIMQDLLGAFMANTFECKSILEQDMSKRKQSEWAGVLIPPLRPFWEMYTSGKLYLAKFNVPPPHLPPQCFFCQLCDWASVILTCFAIFCGHWAHQMYSDKQSQGMLG